MGLQFAGLSGVAWPLLSAARNGAETSPGGPAAVVPFPVARLESRAVAGGISRMCKNTGGRDGSWKWICHDCNRWSGHVVEEGFQSHPSLVKSRANGNLLSLNVPT